VSGYYCLQAAVHEAGHAVVSWFLADPNADGATVRVWPSTEYPGAWQGEHGNVRTLAEALALPAECAEDTRRGIMGAMAGILAEEHLYGERGEGDFLDLYFDEDGQLEMDARLVYASLCVIMGPPPRKHEFRALSALQDKTREAIALLGPWVLRLGRKLARDKALDADQLRRWFMRSKCPRFSGRSVLRSPMTLGAR
jgi:hypothetical protein